MSKLENRFQILLVVFFVACSSPATYAQNPDKPPSRAPAASSITATPNPVTSKAGELGTTRIIWNTGDGFWGQVYVSENGKPEALFNQGAEGAADAPWIGEGVYKFRLYAGTDHKQLLAAVQVTHGDNSIGSPMRRSSLEVSTTKGIVSALMVPSLGMLNCQSLRTSKSSASNP